MQPIDKLLTEAELHELESYLTSEALPETCMDLEMLDGFVSALVVGPEPILPSEWLPLALGFLDEEEEALEFRDEREGERVVELTMRYYNGVALVLNDEPAAYAPLFYETEGAPDAVPIALAWAEGFMAGIALRQEAWKPLIEDEEASQLTVPLVALAALEDDPELGELYSDAPARRRLVEMLPETVLLIRDYWCSLGDGPETFRREMPKVGRNDLCPCGSGKKYKMCCGAH